MYPTILKEDGGLRIPLQNEDATQLSNPHFAFDRKHIKEHST